MNKSKEKRVIAFGIILIDHKQDITEQILFKKLKALEKNPIKIILTTPPWLCVDTYRRS